MAYCAAMIVSGFFTARLSDRYGRGPIFFYRFLVSIFAVLVIPGVDTFSLMIPVAALQGQACAIYRPSLTALVADRTKAGNRGTIFSFYDAAFDIGIASAGLIFGIIADHWGFNVMFYSVSLLGAVGLVFFLSAIKPGISRSMKWTLRFKRPEENA